MDSEQIEKTMKRFNLNKSQAKLWHRYNAGGELYGRDSFIKEVWKEAQKELLGELKPFIVKGDLVKDLVINKQLNKKFWELYKTFK